MGTLDDLMEVTVPAFVHPNGVEVRDLVVTEEDARRERIRAAIGGHGRGMFRAGTVKQLIVDDVMWMSDTPDERRDHSEPLYQAMRRGGRVLVNGLGLGMVIGALTRLDNVEHVDVVEVDARIIEAVGPFYASDRVTIHYGDALTMQWRVGTRWSVAWHDIWPYITSENLPTMARLHRMYGRRTDWQGSWARYECERARERWG